ncbi:MAG: hypothetical protein P0116_12700 [Candidatus Nitrosocosmicus sp.]|nr:hypothetical protein [Candidatus Nitrosocosmicus sp.]
MTITDVKTATEFEKNVVIDALKLAFVADPATSGMARFTEIPFKFL